jgi:large conductance mechanosensitive channel
MRCSNLCTEFKAFALKGNIIDLAVAVIIGVAFGAVISSLVKDVIMPVISYLMPANASYTQWTIGAAGKPIYIGRFIGEVVNFFIVALAVFLVVVKLLGSAIKRLAPPAAEAPKTKECPLCLSTIPSGARRCAHCCGDLP